MTEPTPSIEHAPPTAQHQTQTQQNVSLPRITIKYCTQCKWLLRAAYFAQELLSTFSTALGEVALVPVSGGVFVVTISRSAAETPGQDVKDEVIWDRKRDGGFPETKILKSLVRNVIEPERDLGHTDRALKGGSTGGAGSQECKDCK